MSYFLLLSFLVASAYQFDHKCLVIIQVPLQDCLELTATKHNETNVYKRNMDILLKKGPNRFLQVRLHYAYQMVACMRQ